MRRFNAALEVTQAPTWAPARLKVLVAATQVISRSAISGAATMVGVCLAPSKTQIAMDLVGDQDQVVLGAEGGQRADLVDRPDGAAGIVRAAKEDDLRPRRQLRAQRIEVHAVATVGLDQLRIENAPLIGEDDPAERMIGGREDDHLVAGRAHRLKDEAQPGNDAGRRAHPGRVDPQAVPARHPIRERGRPGARIGVVAVDRAPVLGRERFGHAGRRGEIHVRHPHRDRIRRLDAREPRHVVPFRRVRAAALDHAVEIEHGARLLDGACRNRPFKLGAARPVKR